MIEYIKLYELHGERDVVLSFEDDVKIIIGDNGSGKTTVLGALYAVLSLNFHKLSKLDFERIELKFRSGDVVSIDKTMLGRGGYFEVLDHPIIEGLNKRIAPDELIRLLNLVRKVPYTQIQHMLEYKKALRKSNWTGRDLYDRLNYLSAKISMDKTESLSPEIEEIKRVVAMNSSGSILYLPTYRRVEEALDNLGYLEDDFTSADQLIQFGMNDVKYRFNKIKTELKDSAVKLYTNLNGRVLNQLTSGYKASEFEFEKVSRLDELQIVLSRVGDSISETTRQRIIELIKSGDIKQDRYHPLVFVLSNLVDVYLEQKETDESIKIFIQIANKYLVNKEFNYDENNVDISVVNKKTRRPVELEYLSSGEKQLISLFSKLYLDKASDYIVIFDEPELSLSIEWQETLLPDIIASGKCKFMVAATHSPFIFDNELDNKTGIIEVLREE